MKRIVMMAVLSSLLFSTVSSYAQGRGGWRRNAGNAMSPEERMKRLSKELELTGEQKEKIKPILEDDAKQFQSVRQDSSLSREEKVSKAREIHTSGMEKIRPILTADQQKKLDEMIQQAKDKMQQRGAAN